MIEDRNGFVIDLVVDGKQGGRRIRSAFIDERYVVCESEMVDNIAQFRGKIEESDLTLRLPLRSSEECESQLQELHSVLRWRYAIRWKRVQADVCKFEKIVRRMKKVEHVCFMGVHAIGVPRNSFTLLSQGSERHELLLNEIGLPR